MLIAPVTLVVSTISVAFSNMEVLEGEKGPGLKSYAPFVLPLLLSTCLGGVAVSSGVAVD